MIGIRTLVKIHIVYTHPICTLWNITSPALVQLARRDILGLAAETNPAAEDVLRALGR